MIFNLHLMKDIAAIASPIITLAGFYFLYSQLEIAQKNYVDTAKKQRVEYIDGKIQKQFTDQNIKMVLQMLDYDGRTYWLPKPSNPKELFQLTVFHSDLASAEDTTQKNRGSKQISLRDALDTVDKNHAEEKIIIREMFDEFFSHIESLERLLENSLLKNAQIEPYYRYCIACVNIEGKKSLGPAIKTYAEEYGFEKAHHFLFERFKKSSSPASNPQSA